MLNALVQAQCNKFGIYPSTSYVKQDFRSDDWLVPKVVIGAKWHKPFDLTGDRQLLTKVKATLGRQRISELPEGFRRDNHGRFVAITFAGRVVATADTLEELNGKLASLEMKENLYVQRIGYRTIAHID